MTVQRKILAGENFDKFCKFVKIFPIKCQVIIIIVLGHSSIFSSSIFQREVIFQNFPQPEFYAVRYDTLLPLM